MAYNGRPGGVTFVAIIVWLTAIVQIWLGVLVLIGVLSPGRISLAATWVSVVIGVITLVVSFGLFGASNLARIVVTISLVLSILGAVLQAIAHQTPNVLVGSIITSVLAATAIALLYSRRANRFFA